MKRLRKLLLLSLLLWLAPLCFSQQSTSQSSLTQLEDYITQLENNSIEQLEKIESLQASLKSSELLLEQSTKKLENSEKSLEEVSVQLEKQSKSLKSSELKLWIWRGVAAVSIGTAITTTMILIFKKWD